MSWHYNELRELENYITYDECTNIAQCLIPECQQVFVGKKTIPIKRHYLAAHKMNIELMASEAELEEEGREMDNQMSEGIHNSFISEMKEGEGNPYLQFGMNFMNDNKNNGKKLTNNEHTPDTPGGEGGGKGYRTFLVAEYVDYNKETNISKCLVRNCERPMSGRRTGNIKRHYHKVHSFVIVHDNPEESSIRDMNKELREYYNNDSFDNAPPVTAGVPNMEEDMEDDNSDNTEQQPVNYEQYIDYDPLINKSLCKVPGCKAYLVGKKPFSIARHYGLVHNFDIESNGIKNFDKSKYSKTPQVQSANGSLIPVDDLVIYDMKSQTYQCLFINCNKILEKHLPTIKQHYHEKHKIIIARDSDNIPHRFYRKRKQHEFQQPYYDQDFCKDYQDYSHDTSGYSIKNEALSDDEQPQCSKRYKTNPADFLATEMEECPVKKEYNSEEEQHVNTTPINHFKEKPIKQEPIAMPKKKIYLKQNYCYNNKDNSTKVDIQLTKQKFLNLCLGLVIERNLPLDFFDDEMYFKPLLAPYEQVFDSYMNRFKMEELLLKANNYVVNDLKKCFNNRIVSLELYVVGQDERIYLIFNIRYLEDETVQNKVIGFLPINETTTILPISDYLNKFNIDEQQVYKKTILAASQENEKIHRICENLLHHNPGLENHSIYQLQIILITFKYKFSQDIKNWQDLTKYQTSHNFLQNLKQFENYVDSLNIEEYPELLAAKQFFKTLEIFDNFMDKLTAEQYVAGDFYRDLLCCELELKSELKKNNNLYAGNLSEELLHWKNSLLDTNEFTAALYLDVRFNFLASRLITEQQKAKGKIYLCTLDEQFHKFIHSSLNNDDHSINNNKNNDDTMDDEYALLNEHINDIMPSKSHESLEEKLLNCIPSKREPFSLDILKYWHANRHTMCEINELTKITFTYSCSQYILKSMQFNFNNIFKDIGSSDSLKYDKFLLKFNGKILEKKIDLLF